MSPWQFIFLQSRINLPCYSIVEPQASHWSWPKETWFQNRLNHIRNVESPWKRAII